MNEHKVLSAYLVSELFIPLKTTSANNNFQEELETSNNSCILAFRCAYSFLCMIRYDIISSLSQETTGYSATLMVFKALSLELDVYSSEDDKKKLHH